MDISELNKLMAKIKEDRDEIVFSNIFDFLAPKIKDLFHSKWISNENAEELTQEVMSIVWVKSDKYDPSKLPFQLGFYNC